MSKKIILRKLGDKSQSYKNIFNGMYDKKSDTDHSDENPVCRLCLNYVIGRGFSSRYEDAHCWKRPNEDNEYKYFKNIPFCDKCGVKIHDEFDEKYTNYTKYQFVILACGEEFYIDSIQRGNM